MMPPLPRLISLVRKKGRSNCALLPGVGGGLEPYLMLASALGTERNVYAVRAGGLMPGERPERSIGEIAVAARTEITRLDPELVLGWSLGGVAAWELCLALPQPVPLVVVDAAPCPWVATADHRRDLRCRVLDMLGPKAEPDTVQRVIDTFELHMDALAAHNTTPGYSGPVMLVAGRSDDGWRDKAVERWQELAPALRVERLDAGHYDILSADRLPLLIADFLEVAQ
jgi:thioesterase domain-containing protein